MFDFFRQFHQNSQFLGQISEKFRFFQVILQKSSISQGKFPKNFDSLGNLTKHFDFLRKFRFFTGNFTHKINCSRQISEKFRFFQVISQKSSIFQGKFSKNFDLLGNKILRKISIFQAKLAIYSYFWVN